MSIHFRIIVCIVASDRSDAEKGRGEDDRDVPIIREQVGIYDLELINRFSIDDGVSKTKGE